MVKPRGTSREDPFVQTILLHFIVRLVTLTYSSCEGCRLMRSNLQGRPSLWGNDAFPPVSDFPPYSKNISNSVDKFPQFDLFQQIFSIFILQNFWRPFLSHGPYILDFPYFACFTTFPPWFAKIYYFPPTFQNFPLFSKNSTAFYILYVYFPPYFHHDAFMHHPMHVLDASENDDGSLPDGRFIGFYATRWWDEWDGLPLPISQPIMDEQLVQGRYAVAWGRFKPATLRLQGTEHHRVPSWSEEIHKIIARTA